MKSRLLVLLSLSLFLSSAYAADEPVGDPWESVNRQVFAFNEGVDRYFVRPIAKGYRWLVPDPVERSLSRFVSNIGEVNNVFNAVLQGSPEGVVNGTGRFLINSTVGLAGLFDVASSIGLEHTPTDFGQTLYVWGVDSGPFVVLPVLGPRTLRGGAGAAVDSLATLPYALNEYSEVWGYYGLELVDTRSRLLDAEELISGDKYIFTRNAYLQRRQYFLSGEVQDSFSDYEEEDFEDF
ncbi:MAG: VacJ family lipoprotein [Halioglobus sp.]